MVFVVEKPVVRKVLIAGLKQVPLSDVNEVLNLEKGEFYDPKQVEENRLKIKEVMDDAGLYLAQVRQDVKIKGAGRRFGTGFKRTPGSGYARLILSGTAPCRTRP